MYFCPKCHFSFDIGKTTNAVTENKELIKKSSDAFKKLEDNEDLSKYKADFKFEELIKNSKYKKILPRTNYYICKNISCVTNLKNTKKEAVFFRELNSFKVNYICCICFNGW